MNRLALLNGADLPTVEAERLRRGQTIRLRREAHGIRSLRAWAELTGINRATVTGAEKGAGSDDTLDRLEQCLDEMDAEKGIDTTGAADTAISAEEAPHLQPGVIETVIKGPSHSTRWEVTFHSSPEDLPQVTLQVERLLKALEEPLD